MIVIASHFTYWFRLHFICWRIFKHTRNTTPESKAPQFSLILPMKTMHSINVINYWLKQCLSHLLLHSKNNTTYLDVLTTSI